MTRHFARKSRTLVLIALFALLATTASLAQIKTASQSSIAPTAAPAPQGAVALQHPLPPGASAEHFPLQPGHKKKIGSVPAESQGSLFLPVVLYDSSEYDSYYWVAIADVNGDGKPDLIVANQDTSSQGSVLEVFLGNGDGTFQRPDRNRVWSLPPIFRGRGGCERRRQARHRGGQRV
jgi:hypothetical protein